MTQLQLVLDLFNEPGTQRTIKDVAETTGIKEPNIRRILGQGAKAGIFERTAPGVYTVKNQDTGTTMAYLYLGLAEEILPHLLAEGKKYNMMFLDPAYYSRALIGGNRGIKGYDFIHPDQFGYCVRSIHDMLLSDHSHVYLMLSGAPTAQNDMQKYIRAAVSAGLRVVTEGRYQKLFSNGLPVTNVRGQVAAPERLILLSRSGMVQPGEIPSLQMEFSATRPPIKTSYPTQKAEELYQPIIRQSTHVGDAIADAFTGSGMFGKVGVQLQRIVTMIEKSVAAFDNHIIPNLEQAFI